MKSCKLIVVSLALCAFFKVSPSFAMEEEGSYESNLTVAEISSFSHLEIEHGSVLFLDIDGTLFWLSSRITKYTSEELLKKHQAFCEAIEQVDLESHQKLQSAGGGMIDLTEEIIPDILEKLSRNNVILIPFTNRPASEESIEISTKQLSELGYNFNTWNEGKVKLRGTEYEDASFRDGILYANLSAENPNKGLGVRAVTKELQISAFGFVDDKKENVEAVKDVMASSSMRGRNYKYSAPPREFTVKKIKKIYRRTLKEKFEEHEELFKKHFN